MLNNFVKFLVVKILQNKIIILMDRSIKKLMKLKDFQINNQMKKDKIV